jgi:hypothetical protein
MALRVVKAEPLDREMLITVEGDTLPEVMSYAARKLAYAARVEHNMHSAGVETYGGPYPVGKDGEQVSEEKLIKDGNSKKESVTAYRNTFRLTKGI